MEDLNLLDDLFEGDLDSKMDFLSESSKSQNDGLYKVDLNKVKDKKKGWRSVVRLLPNFTKEGRLGQSAIEKISHYVDIKEPRELSGYFDSPKNFGEKCALSNLYYNLKNSKNAILMEKADCLKYSRKYYSYVLVLEDEQQPELVGKIMIMQYGIMIKDKIQAEKNGEVLGTPCNVFDLSAGKDFVLIAKENLVRDSKSGKEINYPDYKMSMFKPETSSIPIFFKEKGTFKNVPLSEDGKVDIKYRDKIKEFLLDREFELEDFAPKKLTEEQQEKITEITNFLTGKTSVSYNNRKNESNATSNDLDMDDDFSTDSLSKTTSAGSSTEEDEDDFFSDF